MDIKQIITRVYKQLNASPWLVAAVLPIIICCSLTFVLFYQEVDYYYFPLKPEEYDHHCWPFFLPTNLPNGVEPTPQVFPCDDGLGLSVEYKCQLHNEKYKLRMFMRGSCETIELEGTSLSWRVESSRAIKSGVYETVVYVSIETDQGGASYRVVSPYSITQTLQIVESLEPALP